MDRFMSILCVLIISLTRSVNSFGPYINDHKGELFKQFIGKYSKSYINDTKEYLKRAAIFRKNFEMAENYNHQRTDNNSAWYGITKFSDLSPEEFEDQFLSGYIFANASRYQPDPNDHDLRYKRESKTNKIDWRTKGKVTPVKNQKSCGGCWAFSAAAVIESAYAQKYSTLMDFSVQEILDCSKSYKGYLHGCQGGIPCYAFMWLNQTRSVLVPQEKYPFKSKNEYCTILPKDSTGVMVNKFACHKFTNQEEHMLSLLRNVGPLSVAVDARNWQNYQGGIIKYHCPSNLNHAVTIVGYDQTGPVPFYIIKNSWGTDWGHSGYAYLRVGVDICGIAQTVSWVTDITRI